MEVKFIQFPENDIAPMGKIGVPTESIIYELKSNYTDKPNSKFWLTCFKCGVTANLGDHDVEIKDGKVTIFPSILCPREECKKHYYIRNGVVEL